jgi:hypothetical protein
VVSLAYVQPLLRGAWRQYATATQTIADLGWRRALEHQREVRLRLFRRQRRLLGPGGGPRATSEVPNRASALAPARSRSRNSGGSRRGVGTQIDVLSAETHGRDARGAQLAVQVLVRSAPTTLRQLILPSARTPAQWETDVIVPATPLPDGYFRDRRTGVGTALS